MTFTRPLIASVFVRILLVLLACVVTVQAVNFGLFLIVGPPPPRVYAVSSIAEVLRGDAARPGELRLEIRDEARQSRGGLPASLANALARQLGVAGDQVRLEMIGPAGAIGLPVRAGPMTGPHMSALADGVVAGDFVAALRRADGRWTILRPAQSRTGQWQRRTLLWLVTALVAIIPFAWILARRVSRPITMFAKAAQRIGRDPKAEPLRIHGPSEIIHAAAEFNEMQRRLNRYVEDRTMMIGAIAHDLRTPLMRLSLRLDTLPEEVRRACEADLTEMQAMIRAAADYVRDLTQTGSRRRLDLRSLAESVVDACVDREEAVTMTAGESVVVEADPTALQAVLINLIGNALRYAGDAEVSVTREQDQAILMVRDHGAGVPEADLPRVFLPFFRGEPSRNRDTGGIGFGLASVRGIARGHGGEATLINHPDGGVLVRVILPL